MFTYMPSLDLKKRGNFLTSSSTGEIVAEIYYDGMERHWCIAFDHNALYCYGRTVLTKAVKKAGFDKQFPISDMTVVF